MPSVPDFALLATNVYDAVRNGINDVPVPPNWDRVRYIADGNQSSGPAERLDWGFSAGVFERGDEVVISFTGTNENIDWIANAVLASALVPHPQLVHAAQLVVDVKQKYAGQDKKISLTGHSLGGGLAALMAVYFDLPATTFAGAPFTANANSLSIVTALKVLFDDPKLDAYRPILDYAARSANVNDYSVEFEALSIGLRIGRIAASQTFFDLGGSSINPIDRHSMVLHAALSRSTAFQQAVVANGRLVDAIFDDTLFLADPQTTNRDVLTHLVGSSASTADGMTTVLDHFSADMHRLVGEGAVSRDPTANFALYRGLVGLALQHYNESNADFEEYFLDVSGIGIEFDVDNLSEEKKGLRFIEDYLWRSYAFSSLTTTAGPSGSEQVALKDVESYIRLFNTGFVATSDSGVTLTDTSSNGALLIGAMGADSLTGGAGLDMLFGGAGDDDLSGGLGADVLIGGLGADALAGGSGSDSLYGVAGDDVLRGGGDSDVLSGGAGNDVLEGGDGFDKYLVFSREGLQQDTVDDADHLGVITLDGTQLSLANARRSTVSAQAWEESGFRVRLVSGDISTSAEIQVSGGRLGSSKILVKNFKNQDLGIALDTRNEIQLAQGAGRNPYSDPNYQKGSSGSASTMNELAVLMFSIWLPFPALIGGQEIRLSLDALADKFRAILGDSAVPFTDGTVSLFIPEGQSTVTFALEQSGDIDLDQELTFTATLLPGAGDEASLPLSHSLTVALDAREEATSGTAPQTARTILGDLEPADTDLNQPGIQIDFDDLGNPIQSSTPAPDRHDTLNDSAGNDLISPGGGNDVINAFRGGDDSIKAGTGNDQVNAGDGDDFVDGEDGDDRLDGGAGDDQVAGSAGRDVISGDTTGGSTGNDFLEGGSGGDFVYGHGGDDYLYGEDEVALEVALADTESPGLADQGDFLQGMDGADLVVGSERSDVVAGGDGDDVLVGGGGSDFISGDAFYEAFTPNWEVSRSVFGDTAQFAIDGAFPRSKGAGNDRIHAGGGNDDVLGGPGNDVVFADAGDDMVFGEEGDDTLLGGSGADLLAGDNGSSPIHGNDFLDGGDGNDRLFGQGGNDALFGGAGNDYLLADSPAHAPGDDYLSGEDGDDELIGLGGRDVLYGGAGHDQLFGDSDDTPLAQQMADELFGGDGDDLLQGYGGGDYLDGGAGNDTALGGPGEDRILGGAGDDTLVGDAGSADPDGGDADLIEGGDGNDALFGQGGDDQLLGGDGLDQLQAGAGNDFLDGGAGTDTLLGEAGTDELHGGADDDTLAGGMGEDVLYGGDGDDLIAGDNGGTDPAGDADFIDGGAGDDQVAGQGGDDTLEGGDGDDVLAGDAGNDLLAGGTGADQLFGGLGEDRLEGGDGDDLLAGGEGDDVLAGGAGNDTYGFSQLANGVDTIVDSTAGGDTNTISIPFAYFPGILQISLGSLRIRVGTGIDIHIDGFDPDDPFSDPAINRFEFDDGTVKSYPDVLAENRFDLRGTPQSDVLEGTVLEDNLSGLEGDDVLIGKAGNDQLIGGAGADVMLGNEGDDLYHVDDPDDLVLEDEGEGIDTVSSTVRTLTLAGNAENLSIGGIGGTAEATGNELDNVITVSVLVDGATLRGLGGADTLVGTNGADVLDGGTGDDVLAGGFGDDSYYVDSDNDAIEEFLDSGVDHVYSSSVAFDLLAEVEHLTLVEGSGAVSGVGNLLDNVITGNSGGNILAGERQLAYGGLDPAVGRDLLLGLGGDDQLDGWIGDDRLEGGDGDDELYGRAGADLLFGGDGDDRLDGSTLVSFGFFGVTVLARDDDAIDILEGGAGNDTYVIGDADDVILESPDGGEDTVEASLAYTLGANLENLTLTGEVPLIGSGNDGANRLRDETAFVGFFEQTGLHGLGGDDLLENGTWMDGGEGADVMIGRPGVQATYFVDNAADVVIEQPVDFVDEIYSTVTYTAPANVENLTLIGTAAIDGYGNALTNRLTGNDAPNRLEDPFGSVFASFGDRLFGMGGDDVLVAAFGDSVLDGGSGADLMRGGVGDDTYYVDSSADRVEELPGEGFDTVHATASFALDDHTEALYLEGDLAIDGTGGAGDNVFYGNLAANRLAGGAGDDTYFVQNELDTVVERPGEGFDQVFSTASFVLGADVEAITLEGMDAIDATGNDAANAIEGNDADNVLAGLGGDDDIDGGAGNDTIEGGDGDDVLYGGDDADSGGGGGGEAGSGEEDPDEGEPLPNHDVIRGGAGNDVIDGGSGSDNLFGDAGDDILYAGDAQDSEGYSDHLFGGDGDDVLYGDRDQPDNLSGGAGDDVLIGGGGLGGDIFDGGPGIDYMEGGLGGDRYVVDGYYEIVEEVFTDDCGNPAVRQRLVMTEVDTIVDPGLLGDTVWARVSYVLPASVSYALLQLPTDPIAFADFERFGMDLTGNALKNEITGNAFANRLDGGAGDDTLRGGLGDDTYVIDSTGDVIIEAFGEGIDTVETTLQSYALPGSSTLDHLTLLDNGSAQIRIAGGNGLDNVMRGSSGRDNLVASFGNDTLYGGAGEDFLQGQEGNDQYRFRRGDGVDTIIDFSGVDTLRFLESIAPGDLAWETLGADVHISIAGTADKVILRSWMTAFDRLDRVVFCDGTLLDRAAIEALVAGNRAPMVASPLPDQSTLEDEAYVFAVPASTFADPDPLDVLAYAATLADGSPLPAWLSFDAAGVLLSGTPANADVGDYTIRVSAADPGGKSASDDFVLTVVNVNDAPIVADPIADRSVQAGAEFSFAFAAGAFLDIDEGDALGYAAALMDGSPLPAWLVFDAATRTFAGTAPGGAECGCGDGGALAPLDVRVTATDLAGAAVFDEFSLVITADPAGEHIVGTKHKDALSGTDCDDVIEGLQGNDRLYGLEGNDVLAGGRGNDHLEGGRGEDIYVHHLHDGHDTVRETGPESDTLALGEGIDADRVRLRRHHDDLVVDIHGRGGSVTIEDWFKSARRRVESLVFADGTTWDEGEIRERTRRGDHGTDRCDPPRSDHHGDRDDHHGHARRDGDSGEGDEHRGPRDGHDGMRHRLSQAPRFEFEALVAAFDRSGRHPSPAPADIERRWTAVARYASALHEEGDDSRRGAPAFDRVHRAMPGLEAAHGWGFDGSTGTARERDGFKGFEGIREGFHRL